MDKEIENSTKDNNSHYRNHLYMHYCIVILLYFVAAYIALYILSLPETQTSIVTLLSSGAILATFGSAIGSVGLIWQNDLSERVRLNVDILNKDIFKHESTWRRWPFLPRSSKRKLLNGGQLRATLSNPEIPLDVGTHVIKIHLPTTIEDFFDLPLLDNLLQLLRFRSSALTFYGRKSQKEKSPETGLTPSYEHMAYECMFDIWRAVFKFRVARYVIHFGSATTISGACFVALYILLKNV